MKKLLALSLATGVLSSGVLAGVTTFADTNKSVDVSYSTSQGIPDPTDPSNPEYVVNVPASIVFSDDNKTVDASVEMTAPDGTAYTGTKQADVTVASKNEYKLKNGSREVAYELHYGQNLMSQVDTNVGTLSKTNAKIEGTANLTGKALATGNYSDVLTYTVAAHQ